MRKLRIALAPATSEPAPRNIFDWKLLGADDPKTVARAVLEATTLVNFTAQCVNRGGDATGIPDDDERVVVIVVVALTMALMCSRIMH